ncbi:MAG TPA: MotA/TolQ/ExbB proton channel family protein [Desulfobacterales bacterium]|jgi:biopolymer transport protein ExbB|nr:MotA/TolQ/ExbB proton channel family protein [Desulfobacterales bacterium]
MWQIFVSGGPVMYPLLACSVLVLAVIIERAFFWMQLSVRRNPRLVDEVLELSRRADWEAIRQRVAGSKDYIVKILVTGIVHREFSLAKAMESAAMEEIEGMRRFMRVMDTMITVAPLLGIFGTVLGIISSFEMLGAAGIEHPETVTSGIAQALITTAAGLGIAILTVFPFNYFNARVEAAALTIEKYATSLEVVFERLGSGGCSATADGSHEASS